MKKILIVIFGVFILMQLIRIDRSHLTIDKGKDFASNEIIPTDVRAIVKRSCYDCHSFETNYPWYANVSPVSWWIKGHINEGRKFINFSIWETYANEEKSRKLLNSLAYIKPDMMPLPSYISQHPEAKLSVEDKKILNEWMMEEAKRLDPNLEKEE
ncbi:heme-binding domain-containing protein [Faecalibacter rhinopitheci]|uniref:Heme-binding domain-containing protein n=1 Tax=Faecalibacter rhinopitheci TaxID=2779678 RepID=A0A8J7FLY9_9FLAO|nr:heme-binding domain-containing protein [Faecalibacter rhinopitheci]MBF0596782.1 heme-binding domain-containing protein [Faecalibacter rhinopitheci]